jgi:DNA-binding helix-hairpin-helix protein with protein kinase domain
MNTILAGLCGLLYQVELLAWLHNQWESRWISTEPTDDVYQAELQVRKQVVHRWW